MPQYREAGTPQPVLVVAIAGNQLLVESYGANA